MCGNCKDCKNCSESNASGDEATYNPALIATWIKQHILPESSVEEIKAAYPNVMVYFDANSIEPTEENIIKYSEDLNKAIQNPIYLESLLKKLEDKKKVSPLKFLMPFLGIIVLAVVVILILKRA